MRRLLPVLLAALAGAAGAGGTAMPAAEETLPPAPRIRVEPDRFDFGRALPDRVLRKEFVVRNFGDAPLVIEDVSTTCGCTAALATASRIPPGGSTALRVTLETRGLAGRIERQVLVRSNDPRTPLLPVKVSATVEKAGGEKRKP